MVGTIVALVLVELAFRAFWTLPPWFAEFQQAGMYAAAADGAPALRPGYRGTLRVGDAYATDVRINALGMRGPEIGARRPGEERVLMVGDSLVFGYGVEDEHALPARVEAELAARGVVATVGNGGVPGYGSRHYVEHLRRLDERFGADLLVCCGFLGNDAVDDTVPNRTVYAGLMLQEPMASLVFTSWRARLALRSRAALWVEAWILEHRPSWSPLATWSPDPETMTRAVGLPPETPQNQRHAGLFLDVRDERHTWQPGAEPVLPRLLGYLRASLQRAADTAGRRPLVFVILPTKWQVDESLRTARLRELGLDPKDYERGLAQARWRAVAEGLGIPTLDATPILAAAKEPADELFIADGGHFNVRGNEIVAAWLAGELAERLR